MSITRAPSTVAGDSSETSVAPPTTPPTGITTAGGLDPSTTELGSTTDLGSTTELPSTTTVGDTTTSVGVSRAEEAFARVKGYPIVSLTADQESRNQTFVANVLQKGFVASVSAHEVQDPAAAAPRVLVIAIALLPGQGPEGAALARVIIDQVTPGEASIEITIAGEPGVMATGTQNEVLEWSNDELVLLFIGLAGDHADTLAVANAFVTANH